MQTLVKSIVSAVSVLAVPVALAGPLDPDCTVEKAAKSAAMKSTVGVGGRCKPGETLKDSVGLDDKGPIEKMRDDNDGPVGNYKDNHDDDKDKKKNNKKDD